MNIETKWLKDFIVLTETLSFSRASKLRFVTQPAFSRRIQALESSIGCLLFNRSKHRIELTHKGVTFKTIALKLMSELEQGVILLNSEEEN